MRDGMLGRHAGHLLPEVIYAPFPQLDGSPQTCQGSTAYNSFYGSGEIDALKAVS